MFSSKKANGKKIMEAHVSEAFDNTKVLSISPAYSKDEWILDSVYTFLRSPRKEWFFDLKEVGSRKVLIGNNPSCEVLGIGTVNWKL